MKKFAILLILVSVWSGCKKSPLVLNRHFDLVTESEHFVYYQQSDDTIRIDEIWQEDYYAWLTEVLEVSPDFKIDFYKYKSRAQLEDLTGRSTNAFAQANQARIHSIWWKDNHECVHVLTDKYWGRPPAMINEGMAVSHQAHLIDGEYTPGWNGQDFHALTRAFIDNGDLPTMDEMLNSRSIWDFDPNMVYPVSGSFVRFLLDTYGLEKMRDYHKGAGYYDSPGETDRRMTKAFGKSVEALWTEWLDFLNQEISSS